MINVGDGDGVVFGGDGADTITAGDGDHVVLGDHGVVGRDLRGGRHDRDRRHARIPGSGGDDVITLGDGDDVVLGR